MNETVKPDALRVEAQMAEPVVAWPMEVKLRKPIMDKDAKPVRVLTLREPTAGDIERCGNPIKVNPFDADDMQFEAKAMTMMIAALSSTPLPFMRQMDTRDWQNIAWKLAPFFLPSPEEEDAPSSTPTGSQNSTG